MLQKSKCFVWDPLTHQDCFFLITVSIKRLKIVDYADDVEVSKVEDARPDSPLTVLWESEKEKTAKKSKHSKHKKSKQTHSERKEAEHKKKHKHDHKYRSVNI